MQLLTAALEHAGRGWPVFPVHHAVDGRCSCGNAGCLSVAKHPRTGQGFKDATTEPDRIQNWWAKWPDANVGVPTGATSNVVVIDIDPRHGGTASVAELEKQYGALPSTVESLTGGGGRHLFFAHPGQPIANRSSVRPGIDVRGDGGYIVAPPSVHESGTTYCWRPGHSPHERPLEALPNWLLELIQLPAKSTSSQQSPTKADDRVMRCLRELLMIKTVDQKDGSKRLFAAACRCVEFGLGDAEAITCIRAYSLAAPFPKSWSDQEILARVRDAEKRVQATTQAPAPLARKTARVPYETIGGETVWMKPTKDGAVAVPLMNFMAQIVREVVHDDGVEQWRSFEIEAQHRGRTLRFVETAAKFGAMNWPTEQLGANAYLYPGMGTRDHARCAVQMLSGDVDRQLVYEHLGWRDIDGQSVYLHSGGAIGGGGQVVAATVAPPGALQQFILPEPPGGRVLVDSIIASLAILDLAPDIVTVPLWLAIWRAALAPSDFSIFLCGQTGGGKTELAARCQQHYGAELDARHLPANWSSTANSLEALAFAAKETLVVVDDFAPGGTTADIARYHRDADRLLRAQGNQSGRGRLTADARIRPSKPPRGLIIATGEDVPRGHSVRARALIVEMPPHGLDWHSLTACQQAGAAGFYAAALAGFVHWVAPRRMEILNNHKERIAELRTELQKHTAHKRTPGIVAELAWAAGLFGQFATTAGAFTQDESAAFYERCIRALAQAAESQAEHQAASDPVPRFQELLSSAIASGRAHIAAVEGGPPENAGAWGWREWAPPGRPDQVEWQSQADRIGWLDGEDLLLDPNAAYRAALQMTSGEGLPVQPRTLWKRMDECMQLKHREAPHFTSKRAVNGVRKRVLVLDAAYIAPGMGQVGLVGQAPANPEENGHFRPTPLPHSTNTVDVSGAQEWGGTSEETPPCPTCPTRPTPGDIPSMDL